MDNKAIEIVRNYIVDHLGEQPLAEAKGFLAQILLKRDRID